MAKTNILKPTGNVENLTIISAFKVENNTYVVFDSEKMGSMGLPIIYVSKYTTKLEKINDQNEWQSVKNYLKGIISGTNFEYVKMSDNLTADEAYYTPLTLPAASFDAIKSHYVVEEPTEASGNTPITPNAPVEPVMPTPSPVSNSAINVTPMPSVTPVNNVGPVEVTPTVEPAPQQDSVMNLIDNVYKSNEPVNTVVTPNMAQPQVTPTAVVNPVPVSNVQPVRESPVETVPLTPAQPVMPPKEEVQTSKINFEQDKETFLKACENMFDALVSKYQKDLNALEQREQELAKKEAEINAKLKDASEHLANAEAREQVANIAHDNAQRVMDLNNFMPVNPNANQTN
mgnify:CR=1 FL=1